VTDHAAVRAVFYGRNLSGYIDNPILDRTRVNDANTYGGRIALRVVPAEQLTMDFNVLYQRLAQGGYNSADNVVASYTALDQYRQIPEPFLDRGEVYNATIQYQGSLANLTSSTSYSDRSRNVNDDDTGFELLGNGALTPSLQVYTTTSFTEEFRATSIQTKPFSWLAGIYVNQNTTRFFQSIEVAGIGALLSLPSDNVALLNQSATTGQGALFGEVAYSPVDPLTLTVGLRAAEIQFASRALRTGLIFGSGLGNSDATTEHDLLPKFNLAYKLTPDSLIYATASKGYRIGGVNVTFLPSPGFVFPPTYKPDSLWNYEIGVKGNFFDQRMALDVDAFYIDWKDIQLDLLHGDYDYFANAGNATSRGLEAQTAIKIAPAFQIGGQATYTDAKLSTTTPGVGNEGDRLPFVPKLSASLFAEYDLSVGQNGHAYIRADAQYVSTMYTGFGNVNDYAYGNYTLTNARLGFDRGPWRYALFARNIADRRARLFAGPYLAGVITDPSVDSINVSRPRTVGLQLSRSF
jgi:outer membrane receptor protein involved in Fe transport